MAFAFAVCGIDRPRHRRERRCCGGHTPPPYYDGYGAYDREYEDIRYDHVSVSRRRGRQQHDCHNNEWCLCRSDYREPYEFLCHYDPLAGLMEEVHECFIALEAGRFIAQEVADKFEETSREINRMLGYDSGYRQVSRYLSNAAREVRLVPDNYHYARCPQARRRRPWA